MRKSKVRTGQPALAFFIGGEQMPYRKVGYAEQIWYMLRWKLKEVFPMPRFPDHPCRHPGCPKLVPKGKKYCDEHVALHPEEVRSATARGYNARWRRLSKLFLLTHPLCVECQKEGKYITATVVDHIRPHRGDPELFWDPDNWQALCKHHHDVKTRNEDQYPVYHY